MHGEDGDTLADRVSRFADVMTAVPGERDGDSATAAPRARERDGEHAQ
jgi:hypothetical protein